MTSIVLASKVEARTFTKAIKDRIARHVSDRDSIVADLHEAQEREVWKALGYRSMARYITDEFGYSRSNAYNILDQFAQAKRIASTGKVSSAGQKVNNLPPQRESTAMKTALAEQRSGPAPKPAGKRRGFQPPTEQVRHWCETAEGWAELMADDPLDSDFARELRRLNDVVVGMLRGGA